MKVQNNTSNLPSVDSQKIDRLDLKGTKTKTTPSGFENSTVDFEDAARIELSQRAQDLKKIKDIAMAEPPDNSEKIARLQKLIDEGKYNVDSKDIADRMVDEHLIFND